jgi:FKBP-type peptidyl-prolyl cis-trans isomerase
MNLFRSSITLLVPLLMIGCGPKEAPSVQEPVKTATTGENLKELVKEDIKIGAPTKFDKKKKPVEPGDLVFVFYTGTFKDGRELDSNDPVKYKDKGIYSFTVGVSDVIQGWHKGIVGMLPGGERKLSIPYALAYGDAGREGGVPPKTDLYFTIKVVDYVKHGEEAQFFFNDVKVGTGKQVKKGSRVTFHSTITGCDGKVLDDNMKGDPTSFKMGEALPALEEGMMDMKEGGVRELWIPPSIGFPPIPGSMNEPGIYLVTIKLLKVE